MPDDLLFQTCRRHYPDGTAPCCRYLVPQLGPSDFATDFTAGGIGDWFGNDAIATDERIVGERAGSASVAAAPPSCSSPELVEEAFAVAMAF